ncbi:MAG: metallophosphoesterase [Planctomycetota bacterium]
MATWIIGDIHGCAEELAELLRRIGPGPTDTILSVGDLVHRGPDPAGVCDLLDAANAVFLVGNHERALLRRVGLMPLRHDGSDRGPLDLDLSDLDDDDMRGDGRTSCLAPPSRRADIVRYLQRHSGYLLRDTDLDHAGKTPDGRGWIAVHAGFHPKKRPEDQPVETLCTIRRLKGPKSAFWYEKWRGPELVLFGHTHSAVPRVQTRGSRVVAMGLDTGCVFGGSLTAYSPELDETISIPARTSTERVVVAGSSRAA